MTDSSSDHDDDDILNHVREVIKDQRGDSQGRHETHTHLLPYNNKNHKLNKNSIISQSPEGMNHGICTQTDLLYCAGSEFTARKDLNASHCVLLYHSMVVFFCLMLDSPQLSSVHHLKAQVCLFLWRLAGIWH